MPDLWCDDGLVARDAWRLARRGESKPRGGRGLPVRGDACSLVFGIGDCGTIPARIADAESLVGDRQRPGGGCLVGLDTASVSFALKIQIGSRMESQKEIARRGQPHLEKD